MMRFLSFLLILLIIKPSFGADSIINMPTNINGKISQLLSKYPENLNIGISIIDAKTQKIIFKKNEDRYFTPASTQKILTALAAYHFLKPNFQYQTYLFADLQKNNNGILNDNIYFKFTGDPLFSLSQLDELISKLSQSGIKEIKGDIIVDDTVFNSIHQSPGSAWDDQDFCYGSPTSALIVNHNCVSATLQPSINAGGLASISLPEYPQQMNFQSIAKTGLANESCQLKIIPKDDQTYLIKGCIKNSEINLPVQMAVKNPQLNMQNLIFYLLDKHQIVHKNTIQYQFIDHPVKILASTNSPNLSAMITIMLKDSDNAIANSLFKMMGSLYAHEAGSWSNGRSAMQSILQQLIQTKLPRNTLYDGAGVSRYNYLTPKQLVETLNYIYNQSYSKKLIIALPISGMDGTLKNRLKSPELRGKIFAKTGTESGVSTLAGFIRTKAKRTLIFAIMINGFTDSPAKYKELEDKICEIIANANDAPITLRHANLDSKIDKPNHNFNYQTNRKTKDNDIPKFLKI